MIFLEMFAVGFALTLGMEVALGLCFALKEVVKGVKRK